MKKAAIKLMAFAVALTMLVAFFPSQAAYADEPDPPVRVKTDNGTYPGAYGISLDWSTGMVGGERQYSITNLVSNNVSGRLTSTVVFTPKTGGVQPYYASAGLVDISLVGLLISVPDGYDGIESLHRRASTSSDFPEGMTVADAGYYAAYDNSGAVSGVVAGGSIAVYPRQKTPYWHYEITWRKVGGGDPLVERITLDFSQFATATFEDVRLSGASIDGNELEIYDAPDPFAAGVAHEVYNFYGDSAIDKIVWSFPNTIADGSRLTINATVSTIQNCVVETDIPADGSIVAFNGTTTSGQSVSYDIRYVEVAKVNHSVTGTGTLELDTTQTVNPLPAAEVTVSNGDGYLLDYYDAIKYTVNTAYGLESFTVTLPSGIDSGDIDDYIEVGNAVSGGVPLTGPGTIDAGEGIDITGLYDNGVIDLTEAVKANNGEIWIVVKENVIYNVDVEFGFAPPAGEDEEPALPPYFPTIIAPPTGTAPGTGTGTTPGAADPAEPTADELLPAILGAISEGQGVALENIQLLSGDVIDELLSLLEGELEESGGVLITNGTLDADGELDVTLSFTLDSSLAGSGINLYGSTQDKKATSTNNTFRKYFTNEVNAINLGQAGEFPATVTVTLELDMSGYTDLDNLVFYSYNPETNTYKTIKDVKYTINDDGTLSFETNVGGIILVSDGRLTK